MHTLVNELELQRRAAKADGYDAEKLLVELCERLGEQAYFNWVDVNLFDGEPWADVKEKAIIKLEALDYHEAHRDKIPA